MSKNTIKDFLINLTEKDKHNPGAGFLTDPGQKHMLTPSHEFAYYL